MLGSSILDAYKTSRPILVRLPTGLSSTILNVCAAESKNWFKLAVKEASIVGVYLLALWTIYLVYHRMACQ